MIGRLACEESGGNLTYENTRLHLREKIRHGTAKVGNQRSGGQFVLPLQASDFRFGVNLDGASGGPHDPDLLHARSEPELDFVVDFLGDIVR